MQRRLLKSLEEWTAADVDALIAGRVPEGQRLEYKRELDLDPPSQRKEAAKDTSGMSNAIGGLIIYGVAENESAEPVPVEATPLADDGVQARLEDVLDSTIEPTLNFQTRLLDVPHGGYFLLVKVFQRSGPPHMVQGYEDRRHYIRVGIKTRPMTQRELEDAYVGVRDADLRIEGLLNEVPIALRLTSPQKITAMRPLLPGEAVPLPLMTVLTAPMDATKPVLASRQRRGVGLPHCRGTAARRASPVQRLLPDRRARLRDRSA